MYYAAFGIFTNAHTMRTLIGDARLIGRGQIKGFRFEWRGCADIERRPESDLDVVVWDIDQTMLNRLDRVEGYPIGYDRIDVTIVLPGEHVAEYVTGKVYTMAHKGPLSDPGPGMFNTVYRGHVEHGLPRRQIIEAANRAQAQEALHADE